MTEDEKIKKGWMHAADVVADSLERNKNIYTAEGIELRQRFIDTVRACNGEGVDELFSLQETHRLLEEL